MTKKTIVFAVTALMAGMAISNAEDEGLYNYKKIREASTWSTISINTKGANDPAAANLPLVLLIGDSITARYTTEVRAALKGKAYVSMLATSLAVGDPALLDELKLVLRLNNYSVIHFNFGLHGDMSDYREGFADMLNTIQHYAPKTKLIWATTTPCLRKDDAPDENVIERNKIAAEHITKAGIAVDDLYTLIASNPGKLWDGSGVHYTEKGTALQSKQVAEIVVPLLPPIPASPVKP